MKSSAAKLLLLIALIIFPLIIWAIVTQPQDVRSRATDTNATPTINLTPTATPSETLTPTVTPTLTPTPTNSPPRCLGLSANPGAGVKPLTVNFACAGYDSNNDITAAEFGFGGDQKQLVEKNVGQYGAFSITHAYANPGSYNVTCHVRDNNNSWSSYPSYCTYTVVVNDNALTPTPIRTPAPTQEIIVNETPMIYTGAFPTLAPLPSPTLMPAIITPTPTPKPAWWTSAKIMQMVSIVVISGVTIIVALMLHSFFDRR